MAKQTFQNQRGQVHINLDGDSQPAVVAAAGETVTTDNEELKTALRQAGFKQVSAPKESTSYKYKEND